MFVFISALLEDMIQPYVEPVLDDCLCLEEQHYSVMYIFVHCYIFSFCFVKKKIAT